MSLLSLQEKFDQKLRDARRLFVLQPVAGVGKRNELRIRAVAQAGLRHFRYQEPVALPPQNAGRDTNGSIRETGTEAKSRAIPVDHRSDRARLRPGNPLTRQAF